PSGEFLPLLDQHRGRPCNFLGTDYSLEVCLGACAKIRRTPSDKVALVVQRFELAVLIRGTSVLPNLRTLSFYKWKRNSEIFPHTGARGLHHPHPHPSAAFCGKWWWCA